MGRRSLTAKTKLVRIGQPQKSYIRGQAFAKAMGDLMLFPEMLGNRFARWAKGVLAGSADYRRLGAINVEAKDSHFAAHFVLRKRAPFGWTTSTVILDRCHTDFGENDIQRFESDVAWCETIV